MPTTARDNTFLRLNHLDIHANDSFSQEAVTLVFSYPYTLLVIIE
ncbi:hypothetical protein ACMBCN_01290 [Candidatus Liberibacter asiaticus]